MKTLWGVTLLVCAGCGGREASVYAQLVSAQIHVDQTRLGDLAAVQARARFYTLRDAGDQVVLHGAWLRGDSWALVSQLELALPKPIVVTPEDQAEVDLVNRSVTNGSLVGLCDLQLDLGLTVSGQHDRDRSTTLGIPVRVHCGD